MFRHPHRIEVLSALAMATDAGEPLPEALTRLGASDSLLRPWAQRIAVPLREGADLWQVLRVLGLVSKREVEGVSALPLADGLRVLADGLLDPVPGELRIRYLPATFFLAATVPGVVLVCLMRVMTDDWFVVLFRELSLSLSTLTEIMQLYPALLLVLPVAIALVLAFCWNLLDRIVLVRWLLALVFPAVRRERSAMVLLCSALRTNDPRPSTIDRVLDWFWLAARRHDRPWWLLCYQDWRRQSWGVRGRLRHGADPLQERLRLCVDAGLVLVDQDGPDWIAAVHRQRQRLRQVLAPCVAMTNGLILVNAVISIALLPALAFGVPFMKLL